MSHWHLANNTLFFIEAQKPLNSQNNTEKNPAMLEEL
jgi:hypothetical protein